MAPKVSVLMPVYNGDNYLEETLKSVLAQSFTDFEFVVIDDGSKDNTWKILSEYANKDRRIKLFQNQVNIGLIKSLNKGLKLAKGEYIARQDADDISFAKRFERQVEVLDEQKNVALVSCDIEIIDSKKNTLGYIQRSCQPTLVTWHLIFYNKIAGHSQVMFRRQQVLNLGGYSGVNQYSEDYELWSRLAAVGEVMILPEILLQQRFHDMSLCAKRGKAQRHWSLAQSRNNIKELIGKELALEEIEHLRCFWRPQGANLSVLKDINLGKLNTRIIEIYQAFLLQVNRVSFSDTKILYQIRMLTCRQLLSLEPKTNVSGNYFLKLKIYYLAFIWHPLEALKFLSNKILLKF